MTRPLLISIKPHYADLIFNGLKTVELRRRIPQNLQGKDVLIYASNPTKSLLGGFRVGQIWTGTPSKIWEEYSHLAQISRAAFDDYYAGTPTAFALEIQDVWKYSRPKPLDELRNLFGDFHVPQSYRYLKSEETIVLSLNS